MSNKPGRKPHPLLADQVEAFKKLKVGQSFFIPDRTAADVEYLRRPIKQAGMGITIRHTDCDPVRGVAGVRVWRMAGAIDEEL